LSNSTAWAIPTIEKERMRKAVDKISKSADNEQRQDKRILYCTTCKHCFQATIFANKRFYKENEMEIYLDFPSIGKTRVDSCPNCKSKSK
tara:strand:+ start:1363 stop:1632 length:270 start_codon:yes stop_codon:yes gene_type:complete